jgi:dolichol-phosphate mannosyltransferase
MLSVILPTYNEAKNIRTLIPRLEHILKDIPHEIIIVDDDSPDETWKIAHELQGECANLRVRRREGERGLATAVMEGFAIAKGYVFAVMDADGQHDSELLPRMYQSITVCGEAHQNVSVVIASRYTSGGSTNDWRGHRLLGSRILTFFAKLLCPKGVTDPLGGFFAINRATYESVQHTLKPKGFKILLEILASLPHGTFVQEVPLQFGLRDSGESKLSLRVQYEFFVQYVSLMLRTVYGHFMLFFAVLVLSAGLFIPHVWDLTDLYLDKDIRNMTESRLLELVAAQGWLLSDVVIKESTSSYVRFDYRAHVRGDDPVQCYYLRLRTNSLTPCDD